jgi:hypothetical protein
MPDPRVELLQELSDGRREAASDLLRRLDSTELHLRSDGSTPSLLLSMANLCARLIPGVTIDVPDLPVVAPVFGEGRLGEVARRTVGAASVGRRATPRHRIVVDLGTGAAGADLYVTSDRWAVALSTEPLGPPGRPGPATAAAAALAASVVFRLVVPEVGGAPLAGTLRWNLLDYRLTSAPDDPNPSGVEAVVFGAGSVGSSVLYSLLLADAEGSLAFVDPDRLSERNRLRYPLWLGADRLPKASWIAGTADGSRIRVTGHGIPAAEFISGREPPMVAVAAVDTASARRDIVDAFARTTLNAGVDGMRLHVSRHGFGDGYACSYCQYVDLGEALDEVGVFASLTGLPVSRVGELLTGDLLDLDDWLALVEAGKLSAEVAADDVVGARIQDIARPHLYAQAAVRLDGSGLAVSAPFVSALAGAVLAAELVKEEPSLASYRLDRRLDVDCTGLPLGLQWRPMQDRSGRCLCSDPLRITHYRTYWGAR